MALLPGETFETALQRFRTHPVQTALTLTGLVVGTAAIILIVALGITGRAFVMRQIEGVGSNLVWANYRGTVAAGTAPAMDDVITEGDVAAVSARSDLFSGVTGILVLRGNITVQSQVKTLTVIGVMANYAAVRKNMRVLKGRFLDEDDVQSRARVAVVNRPLYRQLFGDEDPSGKTIRTLGTTFQLIGEFEEPVDTLGRGDVVDETILIPITVAWSFRSVREVKTLFAEARDFASLPAAVPAVEAILRERHRPGAVYEVESMTTVVRLARTISVGLIAVFVLAAAISVVVGGVGIMNILLASVEQRTREIGVRMSVGARRKDILRQFLMEALMLGAVGSLIGVVIGVALPAIAGLLVRGRGVDVRISALSALLAFLFSCAVTVLFGVVPASRAANMNPTEALRYE
ncbi:MAG: ABC transporter permease [Acidobacteriota bacterium]|nr:ABC transporter permease [Acidobacteriota bacterium]